MRKKGSSMPLPQEKQHFTWNDYRSWSDDERWEIIGGEGYSMSPAPSTRHQRIGGELYSQLSSFLKGKKCLPFISPVDVKLSEEDVVQPDLIVVCDPSKIKRTHIEGAPDLAVEITSTRDSRDRVLKTALYAASGVKEYWIVTPFPSSVELLVLEGGRYVLHKAFGRADTLESPSFPGLAIPLAEVFDFPLDDDEKAALVFRDPPGKYDASSRKAEDVGR